MKVDFRFYSTVQDEEPTPFYEFESEPGKMSTVAGETIVKRGMPLPITPTFETWRTMVFRRQRCGFCWQPIDGSLAHLNEHVQLHHPDRLAS